MKFYKAQTIVFPIMLALITACSTTSGGNGRDKPSRSSASPVLTEDALNSAAYRIDELGTFQLNNGKFERRYGEGSTQIDKVFLEKFSFGDLDDDGLSDAAVILTRQSGGSATFRYLVAMHNTGNAPRQQASVLLGDRVQISALSIAAGQVVLETVTTGPRDPACCPSHRLKQAYSLRDGKWAQIADKIAEPDAATASNANITGIVWKWERFEGTLDLHNFVIDDSNQYTLILLPDGSYHVKADCNRMQGQYTLAGKHIKIAPGAATLAECAPGSRYAEFLRYLSEASCFVLHENKFRLNLMREGGNLVFEHGGAVSESHRH
jgi:heat shock protein HslJ